jgi:hypothetical protein
LGCSHGIPLGSLPCFEVCTHSQAFQSTDLAQILFVITCASYFTFMLIFAQAQKKMVSPGEL